MTPPRPEAVDDIVAAAQATLMFLVVPEPMIREFCTNLRARLDAALTAAEERAREEQREKDARVCERIYREHKRSKAYSVDMGGLCKECAAAIREGR